MSNRNRSSNPMLLIECQVITVPYYSEFKMIKALLLHALLFTAEPVLARAVAEPATSSKKPTSTLSKKRAFPTTTIVIKTRGITATFTPTTFDAYRGLAHRTTAILLPTDVSDKDRGNVIVKRSGFDTLGGLEIGLFGVLEFGGLGWFTGLAALTAAGVGGVLAVGLLVVVAEAVYLYSGQADDKPPLTCGNIGSAGVNCKTCAGENGGVCLKGANKGCSCNKRTRVSGETICPLNIKCEDIVCGGDTKTRGRCDKHQDCPCCPKKPPQCASDPCGKKGVIVGRDLLCADGPYKSCRCDAPGKFFCRYRPLTSEADKKRINAKYIETMNEIESGPAGRKGRLQYCNKQRDKNTAFSMERSWAIAAIEKFCNRESKTGSMIRSPGDKNKQLLATTPNNIGGLNYASTIIMGATLYRQDGTHCIRTQRPKKVDAKKCYHGLISALDACDTDTTTAKFGGEMVAECVSWTISTMRAPPPLRNKSELERESLTLYDGPKCSSGRISPMGWYAKNDVGPCHMVVGEGALSVDIWHGRTDRVIKVYETQDCKGNYKYPRAGGAWICLSEEDIGFKIRGWKVMNFNQQQESAHLFPPN
ncbi:hypothetical protein K440DRAFT_682331 [Wilcoxina mikolae CBS 423.85]|nr:hypothetical protein K440DRAFT_682331 [Wilcoxina mikolae CBS 423.85]